MRNIFNFMICGGLLWASAAFPASRVGGGTMSNGAEGLLSLTVPARFQDSPQVYEDDTVHLPGPMLIGDSPTGMPIPQSINIYLLRHEFPVMAEVTDRSQLVSYFTRLGWTRMMAQDPCEEIFSLTTQGGNNLLVSWGHGQGLLLSGPITRDVVRGIQSAVDSIILEAGACAWK